MKGPFHIYISFQFHLATKSVVGSNMTRKLIIASVFSTVRGRDGVWGGDQGYIWLFPQLGIWIDQDVSRVDLGESK